MGNGFIAGVDLGASNVRVAVANPDGEIQARRTMPLPPGSPADVIERIGRVIDDLARGVWASAKAAAIGMALPGLVDPGRGTVASPANLQGWGDVDIARILAAPRRLPFAAENDANAAAIGEAWMGAAKEMSTFVFVAMGTGIGAGIVIDHKIHRGAHGLAGEVAFTPVLPDHIRDPGWDRCFEGVAGGRTYAAHAARILGEGANVADLFDAAKHGHAEASRWLRETQEYVAMTLAGMAALLDPEAIIIGGGVAQAQGEWFVAPIRAMVQAAAPGKTPVRLTELGDDAQLIGALKLAADALEQSE